MSLCGVEEREAAVGPIAAGRVIWFTGLSGSGKSTLCRSVWDRLKPSVPQLVLLDGDAVRRCFGGSLGYDVASRRTQIGRIQTLAKMLADQELVVLVAALYSADDLLAWNRAHLPGYFEVYVRASLDLVRRRDSKGLYRGETPDVVGLDIPWIAPRSPDLVVEADAEEPPATVADRVIAAAERSWAPTAR